ncbi:MAG: aldehyde ferredoxin oxidoreductase family protein [Bacillota bacterium]
MSGISGKILAVDLTSRTVTGRSVPAALWRTYFGGSGLAARIMYDEADHTLDPLDAGSPLVFMAGVLTGTPVPSSCKVAVCAKSPLTGIWGESIAGGYWGAQMKACGYDGIIISGRASSPVFLKIAGGVAEVCDAGSLWGCDTYRTSEELCSLTGPRSEVACIGPAGENLVSISAIMFGGTRTRAAGRTGMGAVMGFKNLKGIVVRGAGRPVVFDPSALAASIKGAIPVIRESARGLTEYGTAGGVQATEANGDLPIRNWSLGSWAEGAARICGQAQANSILVGHHTCWACPIRCGKDVRVRIGKYAGTVSHGPEYETCAALGSMVLNDDLDYLAAANDLCNRLGLDTISTGSVIALAMECVEHGVLPDTDEGEPAPVWGDGPAILRAIEQIAYRRGMGEVLGRGSRKAAAAIGGIAGEFSVETKGLEYAFHDPRAFTSMAVNYATANRGACHLGALSYWIESGAVPKEQVGFTGEIHPHGSENKAKLAILMQNIMNSFDALGICKFLMRGRVGPEKVAEWTNAVTGWRVDAAEIVETGERLHNLKRMYNCRLGISRKDDALPPRLMTHDRGTGRAAGSLPHIGKMLGEYYQLRGWSHEGIPEDSTLARLGLLREGHV